MRVLIADDQTLVRAGFRKILEADAEIEVVGEAADGFEAVEAARALEPDVVLMDVRMPRLDGLEATRQLVDQAKEGPRVLVLTTFGLEEYVYEALRAGASGFLLKDVPPEQLLAGVHVVARGDALLDPAITRSVIEEFAARPAVRRELADKLDELTPREREVFSLVARGTLECRDRQGAGGERGHGQEPRGACAAEARPQRSRPVGDLRVRGRRRAAANVELGSDEVTTVHIYRVAKDRRG